MELPNGKCWDYLALKPKNHQHPVLQMLSIAKKVAIVLQCDSKDRITLYLNCKTKNYYFMQLCDVCYDGFAPMCAVMGLLQWWLRWWWVCSDCDVMGLLWWWLQWWWVCSNRAVMGLLQCVVCMCDRFALLWPMLEVEGEREEKEVKKRNSKKRIKKNI